MRQEPAFHEYLLVLPVEAHPLGALYPKEEPLPLHATLVPWFRVYKGPRHEAFEEGLQKAAQETPAITLVSLEPALLGLEEDVPAHLLRPCEELMGLRERVLALLEECGCALPQEEWRSLYRPHVTSYNGQAFLPGRRVKVKCLVLIERREDTRRRIERYFLFRSRP